MRKLDIPRLQVFPASASEVPQILDAMYIPFEPIAVLNWPNEYPYCPQVGFRMAWCPDGLAIHYKVEEQCVRALYAEDGGKVWTDSCVECFVRNGDTSIYYNIECNCIGTLRMSTGDGRHHRRPVPAELMDKVLRWSSLGCEPFEERCQPTSWEFVMLIPSEAFSEFPIRLEGGAILYANFYKCGDELSVPHYVSWNPIDTPQPDFHQSGCFGELRLAED